jgi:membrane protease YdiL (CAAX protease family)
MFNHSPGSSSVWGARSAFSCYAVVLVVVLLVATATALALGYMGVDYRDPPYPLSLVSIPINEVTILLTTLMFFRRSKADLKQLGFRRVSVKMGLRMLLLSIAMLVLTATVALGQNMILGPDPSEQLFTKLVSPRTPLQLAALVVLSMLLVGPVEELFARGYIQQGLENSIGKVKGWLLASLLFGVLHALNVLRAIVPTLVAGLFLGYVWQRTGRNTTAVSIMHGAYDSIALTLAFLSAV